MKRAVTIGLLFLGLLLSGCSTWFGTSARPRQPTFSLIAAANFLQAKHSTSISLRADVEHPASYTYDWTASAGDIAGGSTEAVYTAPPEMTGEAVITVTISAGQANTFAESIPITIYQQFVILKADDFVFDEAEVIPSGWRAFLDTVERKQVAASLGIIGKSLAKGNDEYFRLIRELAASGNIEFWNHGYDHLVDGLSEDGKTYHEFRNTSYAYQKAQLTRTQDLAETKLGLTLHAFGAPGNQIDENTLRAIEDTDEIAVWFFGDPASSKFVLERHGDIEFPVLHPDYEQFVAKYDPDRPYLVFQIHPKEWDAARLDQFERILDYLIARGVTFVTPSEYYQIENSRYVTLVCSECTEVGMRIPLSTTPGRAEVVGGVPHNTLATVLEVDTYKGVVNYRVRTGDVTGWVPEWFVQEYWQP